MPVVGRLYGAATPTAATSAGWTGGPDRRPRLPHNAEAHRQLAALVAPDGVELLRADLPHDRGAGHVLHLLSVVSPVADDLAVVFEPLAPVPLLEGLDARACAASCGTPTSTGAGSNVLAVRPGRVVVVDGNPRIRWLEAASCEAHPTTAPSCR